MNLFSKKARQITLALVLIAMFFTTTGVFAAEIWQNVGSAGFSAGGASDTSLALDGSGTPYVAYVDFANSYRVTVMKFDSTNWVTVGSAGFSDRYTSQTSLALDGSGTPYVAYRDDADKATVMKFDSTNWVTVGSAGFSAGDVQTPSLALDGSGTPYVAYKDQANSDKATVMKFDGTNWVTVGSAGFSAGAVIVPSLVLDGSDTPYVAYTDFSNSYKATVMKFATTDTAPPSKASSVPADGASFAAGAGPSELIVTFDEDVKNDGSAGAANTIANYLLVEAGANGTFDTATCAADVATDDSQITITNAAYTSTGFKATLTLGAALPVGKYRLYVCGTTSIEDLAGNKLNGGTSDAQIDFTVEAATTTASSLPATGFRHGSVTQLSLQPTTKAYTSTAMTLDIPKLGVSMPIVGVPQSGSKWDVTWLGNSAGYLAGSAFPTWTGNTVITGHVWDAYNRPGAFAELKNLKYGDQVEIHAWGQTYTYEVRESKLVTTKNTDVVFQSEQYDWVTLVTCEFYNPFRGEYLFRRAVRAVLVSVQ